jgi:hypothetical protein
MRALSALALSMAATGCGGFSAVVHDSDCALHHQVGFFYCDGFEDGLDPAYDVLTDNGTLKIDGTRVYRGARALHLQAGEGAADDGGTIGPFLEASQSDLLNIDPAATHARVFLYVAGPAIPGVSLRLFTVGGLQLYLDEGDLVLGDLERASTQMPLDRWLCVELHLVDGGAGGHRGSLSIDGEAAATMGAGVGDPPDGVTLQLQHTDPARAIDAWFDELVVDHQPIGCE